MLPVLFRIPEWIPGLGGQPVTSFGVTLLLAFLVAGSLFVRRVRAHRPGTVGWDLVVTAAVAGLLGAKLLHLAVHGLLGLPSGGMGRAGLDWFGGLGAGAAATLWHARRQGLEPAMVAGAAAAPLALGYAIGRVGSFLVGADYGLPTSLPWGVAFPAGVPPTTPANLVAEFGVGAPSGARAGDFVRVHPTQIYEALASLGVFAVLWRFGRGGKAPRAAGWSLFALYLVLGGTARVVVELLRVKQDHIAGPFTVDLLLALAAVGVGAVVWSGGERRTRASEAT